MSTASLEPTVFGCENELDLTRKISNILRTLTNYKRDRILQNITRRLIDQRHEFATIEYNATVKSLRLSNITRRLTEQRQEFATIANS